MQGADSREPDVRTEEGDMTEDPGEIEGMRLALRRRTWAGFGVGFLQLFALDQQEPLSVFRCCPACCSTLGTLVAGGGFRNKSSTTTV